MPNKQIPYSVTVTANKNMCFTVKTYQKTFLKSDESTDALTEGQTDTETEILFIFVTKICI